ncbi:MAG: hypothetical protein ABSG25_06610 [Bryobacteraceae bacterium]
MDGFRFALANPSNDAGSIEALQSIVCPNPLFMQRAFEADPARFIVGHG